MDFNNDIGMAQPPPPTLYHYTSLEALVSIVQSKRLRASNVRFLNDTSESTHLRDDVLAVLSDETSRGSLSEATALEITGLVRNYPPQSLYVASFSEQADLLSQWRAYCPSGLGVCIGFDSRCLEQQWIRNPKNDADPYFVHADLQQTRYSGLSQRQHLASTISELVQSVEKNQAEVEKAGFHRFYALNLWIALLAPFVKHDAFRERMQMQWRKILSKDTRFMPGQQFRVGRSTLIPYVELLLDAKFVDGRCEKQDRYFVNEVLVGPTPTPELTIEAVKALFATEGHSDVTVRQSAIPYRSW